jgi:hypothetical protein
MVILIIILAISICYNLYHFTEFRCYNNYKNIVKKYVNFAGYKYLEIKFTKREKFILKKLEEWK